MLPDFIKYAKELQVEGTSYKKRLGTFGKWFLKSKLPIRKFEILFVVSLLIGSGALGLYVEPHWMGWLIGVFIALGALLFLILEYIQQVLLGFIHENTLDKNALAGLEANAEISLRIKSLQSDIGALQSSIGRVDTTSREIMEAKQSIFYLAAAVDELRKVYGVDIEN